MRINAKNNTSIIFILISLNAVPSLVPSLKFHMHGKLYNPYYSYTFARVPEGGLLQLLILNACVAEKELR